MGKLPGIRAVGIGNIKLIFFRGVAEVGHVSAVRRIRGLPQSCAVEGEDNAGIAVSGGERDNLPPRPHQHAPAGRPDGNGVHQRVCRHQLRAGVAQVGGQCKGHGLRSARRQIRDFQPEALFIHEAFAVRMQIAYLHAVGPRNPAHVAAVGFCAHHAELPAIVPHPADAPACPARIFVRAFGGINLAERLADGIAHPDVVLHASLVREPAFAASADARKDEPPAVGRKRREVSEFQRQRLRDSAADSHRAEQGRSGKDRPAAPTHDAFAVGHPAHRACAFEIGDAARGSALVGYRVHFGPVVVLPRERYLSAVGRKSAVGLRPFVAGQADGLARFAVTEPQVAFALENDSVAVNVGVTQKRRGAQAGSGKQSVQGGEQRENGTRAAQTDHAASPQAECR